MVVITIHVIYQMAETRAVCLIPEKTQEIGRKCPNHVIIFIATRENTGSTVV